MSEDNDPDGQTNINTENYDVRSWFFFEICLSAEVSFSASGKLACHAGPIVEYNGSISALEFNFSYKLEFSAVKTIQTFHKEKDYLVKYSNVASEINAINDSLTANGTSTRLTSLETLFQNSASAICAKCDALQATVTAADNTVNIVNAVNSKSDTLTNLSAVTIDKINSTIDSIQTTLNSTATSGNRTSSSLATVANNITNLLSTIITTTQGCITIN